MSKLETFEEVTAVTPTASLAKEMETLSFSNRPTVRLKPDWCSPILDAVLPPRP